jgi:hypothetical protein
MPQEIEVTYILPAIRRQIALNLIKEGFSQIQVAKVLEVTKAAVSQYVSKKRGKEVVFSKKINDRIKTAAKKIKNDKNAVIPEIQCICHLIKDTKFLCKVHKQHEDNLHCCGLCKP